MNLGFYVHNTSNTPLNQKVYTVLNEALDSGLVPDARLFYDEVDFEKIDKNKCKNSSGKTGSTNTIIKNLCGKFE